jgi:anti-sigma factor RsiW
MKAGPRASLYAGAILGSGEEVASTGTAACQRTRTLLPRHLDGELEGSDRAAVEDHLAACSECRAELGIVTRAVKALRELPEEERSRLREQALREIGADAGPDPFSRRARLIRLAIGFIIFLLVAAYLHGRHADAPAGTTVNQR